MCTDFRYSHNFNGQTLVKKKKKKTTKRGRLINLLPKKMRQKSANYKISLLQWFPVSNVQLNIQMCLVPLAITIDNRGPGGPGNKILITDIPFLIPTTKCLEFRARNSLS